MADPFQCQTLDSVSRTKAIVTTRLSLMQNGEGFQNRLTNLYYFSCKALFFRSDCDENAQHKMHRALSGLTHLCEMV